MCEFVPPTDRTKYDFLLRAYFGEGKNTVQSSIRRAYLDLCRTIRGIATFPGGSAARTEATSVVGSFLNDLKSPPSTGWDQPIFDERHKAACDKICLVYDEAGYTRWKKPNSEAIANQPTEKSDRGVRIGHAQKWLNMSLKYLFVFGEERISGYEPIFNFAHVPLDNIIMDRLTTEHGIPPLPCAWSRIDSYEAYLTVQKNIRARFAGAAPLAVEFALWQ